MTTTAATYWHRDNSGVCRMYRADSADVEEYLYGSGYSRITLPALRRHIREMNAENDAWGSNRAVGPYDLKDIETFGLNNPDHVGYYSPDERAGLRAEFAARARERARSER